MCLYTDYARHIYKYYPIINLTNSFPNIISPITRGLDSQAQNIVQNYSTPVKNMSDTGSSGSPVSPAVGSIIFVVVFVIATTICYFKVAKGCQNLQMQFEMADPVTVDATVNRFHKLGKGGFGVVYRGLLPEGVPVAVKVLNNNLTKQLVEEQFMAEVNSIGRTYHLNLVKLYGYCFEPKLKALVYEFMPNGSLDQILFGEIQTELDWGKRHRIAVGTAKGIAYLHEECQQKITHHDIKPGNVLLDSRMNPKVADFGLARLSNRDSTHVVMSGFKGTPGYAAPEVWTSYVTHKCDVYSFGMMLFEIVGRRRNHVSELSGTSKEWLPRWTHQKIKDGEAAEMLAECGVEAGEQQTAAERVLKVALWCVQYSPGMRPEMSVVVKMLEGEMEVPPPPNPFAYLEETFEFGRGSNFSSTLSSSDQDPHGGKFDTFPRVHEKRIEVDFQSS
ncbi:hypothetical protein V2J09_005570 [Rumex salicifolius]